ncbi:MAG: hypothetical protein R6U27_15520 [Desulfobacterales bacterium]
MKTQNPDRLKRRCPRLGGPVEFFYCKTCDENKQPCFKIFDCWWEIFDVVNYMKKRLSEEQFHKLTHKRPRPKVVGIVELIREIQQRNENSE